MTAVLATCTLPDGLVRRSVVCPGKLRSAVWSTG
jgi:hypothetical protein